MPRLAKSRQTAFDALDRACAIAEIEDRFMPPARIALGHLSDACSASLLRAAIALAECHEGREIPAGHGGALVRHFGKRSQQLGAIKCPIECRFGLVELAVLGGISGGWANGGLLLTTVKSHRTCIQQVVQRPPIEHVDRERWRHVLEVILTSSDSTADLLRNLACALVWCGYLSTDPYPATDEHIGKIFDVDRTEAVRFRQEALRWLPWLLKFSLPSLPGGLP